jgi:hypothetical protein
MDVSWNFTQDQFDDFRTFFNETLVNGSLTFDWEEVGTLSFWQATYSFSRTDNLFSVTATLEVTVPYSGTPPPQNLLWSYDGSDPTLIPDPSGCRTYFSLRWAFTGDHPGFVQTRIEGGTWYDYIEAVPTGAQLAAGVMTVKINNQFGGARFFRASNYEGNVFTTTVHPAESAVPLPDWAISGLSAVRDRRVINIGDGIYEPASRNENMLISVDDMYIEPLERLEWNDASSPSSQVVSLNSAPPGSEWKWTRDGSDPDIDTFLPVFREVNDLACGRDDFGMVVKIRCFSGGCTSPIAVIAIDKRFAMLSVIIPVAPTGPGSSVYGSCDLPQGIHWSGADCEHIYGGQLNFKSNIKAVACSNTFRALSSSHWIVYQNTQEDYMPPDYLGWESYRVTATRFRPTELDPIARHPHWDNVPLVCEYVEQACGVPVVFTRFDLDARIDGSNSEIPLVYRFKMVATMGGGLCGPGGAFHAAEVVSSVFCITVGNEHPCNIDASLFRQYSQWDYLLSIVNEFGTLPIVGSPPAPPAAPPVDGDDFEGYDDSSDTSSLTMVSGTGWIGAWVFQQGASVDGWDYLVDTGWVGDDYSGGYGWVGAWIFIDGVGCQDDFESYADAAVAPIDGSMNLGTGWATNDFGFQLSWIFPPIVAGGDDFLSYTDTADATAVTLEGGEAWASGPWVFGTDNLLDDFESYADDSDATTADAMNGGAGWTGAWTIN